MIMTEADLTEAVIALAGEVSCEEYLLRSCARQAASEPSCAFCGLPGTPVRWRRTVTPGDPGGPFRLTGTIKPGRQR